jgi:hypothetical protein
MILRLQRSVRAKDLTMDSSEEKGTRIVIENASNEPGWNKLNGSQLIINRAQMI